MIIIYSWLNWAAITVTSTVSDRKCWFPTGEFPTALSHMPYHGSRLKSAHYHRETKRVIAASFNRSVETSRSESGSLGNDIFLKVSRNLSLFQIQRTIFLIFSCFSFPYGHVKVSSFAHATLIKLFKSDLLPLYVRPGF